MLSREPRCPDHRWRKQPTPGRGSGGRAAKYRRAVLARSDGRCVICGTTEGVEAHHVLALRAGGDNDPEGGIGLCRKHHREAEAKAARKGR